MFSIYYESASLGNSYIYFGGYATPKGQSASNISWYNVVSTGTNSGLWTLSGKSIKYGSSGTLGNVTQFVFDTGYSQIVLPKTVFTNMIKSINKNCTYSASTGYYMCTCNSASSMSDFVIVLGDGKEMKVPYKYWTAYDSSKKKCAIFVT